MDRGEGQILVAQGDPAGIAGHQADDHVERRGLAGAVRTQQADDLAGAHFQRQVLDDLAGTVALGQVSRAQHGLGHGFPWAELVRAGALPGALLGTMVMCTRPPGTLVTLALDLPVADVVGDGGLSCRFRCDRRSASIAGQLHDGAATS